MLQLAANAERHGITLFGIDHEQQGILHIVPPEQGITQPGLVMVGADSHTSTHGAFGSLAFGVGASEMMHVMATQTLWQRKPKTLRIVVDGQLGFGVAAKDLILAIIAKIGVGGAVGHVIEYAGSTIATMSMEARMTVCNMSIEAGGRAGMIAPDEDHVRVRRQPPVCAARARRGTRRLRTGARCRATPVRRSTGKSHSTRRNIAPMVTWGTNPEQALPITGRVPDPRSARNDVERAEIAAALDYMALKPGMPLADIAVDRVFIGSCTNSRIEDLRAAAAVATARPRQSDGVGGAGIAYCPAPGRTGGAGQNFHGGGIRVARARLLAVHGAQRRSIAAGRTLRVDVQPQFQGASGHGRPHASVEPGDGRGGRVDRPSDRRARIDGQAET